MARSFYPLLQQKGFTYGDDIEIIRLINAFLTYHNLVTKETAIFYQPTAYQGNYFDGIIQKTENSVLVCRAYSDKEENTLHILPVFSTEQSEEQLEFFHAIEKLELSHNNNYFSSGFLSLGLVLKNSKIIFYDINKKECTAEIKPYAYDCDTDSYIPDEHLNFITQKDFLKEAEKEALFRKYSKNQ